jgi:acyl-coenzyme A synthetase/AMP-(fatty) acid ligase
MITLDNPYEARTTLPIDRANRLLALRGHPGFQDLIAISLQTVKAAEAAVVDYDGWDKDELVARSIAFRAAKRSHEMLFVNMAAVIQNGITEAVQLRDEQVAALPNDKKSAEMADELRALVLEQMKDDKYETRIPGSY